MIISQNLGFPRIGPKRELKKALESYWAGETDQAALRNTAATLRRANLELQRAAGIDLIASNDFSLYDHVLDTIALLGAVPPRYRWDGGQVDLDTYFAMARGAQRGGLDVTAMEMTKWFDTNYHYIVPEFQRGMRFRLSSTKPFDEFAEALQFGIKTKPVLLGPVSFLLLGKSKDERLRPLDLIDDVLPVYRQVVARLAEMGAEWIQIDEPCLVQDRTLPEVEAVRRSIQALASVKGRAKLLLQTYFGHVGELYPTLCALPVDAIGLDFVRGREHHLELLRRHGFPADKRLAVGLVNGRNVWINDFEASLRVLDEIAERVDVERLIVSPSCSLLHAPIDRDLEQGLDPELRSWLSFARQKLDEVVTLTQAMRPGADRASAALEANRAAWATRRSSERVNDPAVRQRLAGVQESDYRRHSPFPARREAQRQYLQLPPFPTTTIGSFPQTAEVRRVRRLFKENKITAEEYERFMQEQIRSVIELQEREIGLDVLVHGEFERNDMVEYFGEQLKGFAFTKAGWVQSYGSRYVKPPIIYGDVSRPEPMTVKWSTFAQSCTGLPVKGMLTGPVTILNWSFVRDDQPREQTCRQIALALRDEVADLEQAGIRVIQVDEPALREGLPLRRAEWQHYLDWAVRSFRLATSPVRDDTQVHTHMCYSEFNDIIEAISALDADVISIENSRSDQELLRVFRERRYDKEIGPGVYDIHSPRVPSTEEMVANLRQATEVLDPDQVWVNPDCGLKTRASAEVVPALKNMVAAARAMREQRPA